MDKMTLRLIGSTPILSNNPTLMSQATNLPKTRKSIPTAEVEAEAGTYRLASGALAFPTSAFRQAAISGGKSRKVGRSSMATVLKGALFPFDELTALIDPITDEPLTSYEIDTRRAVPRGQGAIMRSRPRIFPWAADVAFEYDEAITDVESVSGALELAGRIIGVGNFRPEKGGIFGRFTVA